MITDLEISLMGTPADVETATAALAEIGRLAQRGTVHKLTGHDTGRIRLYLRITVATTAPTPPPARRAHLAQAGRSLLDDVA